MRIPLETALADGTFLHPVDSVVPNTVDLFRAVALAAGNPAVVEAPGTTEHVADLAQTIGQPRHLIVVIADGLGIPIMERHLSPTGFFRSNTRRELRAVFPSTTTVALTSIASTQWPGTHGLTGWWTRFPDIDRTIALLPFVERFTGKTPNAPGGKTAHRNSAGIQASAVEAAMEAADLIFARSVWGRSQRDVTVVLPAGMEGGSYNRWFNNGAIHELEEKRDHLPERIADHLRRATGETLTYIYLPDIDSTSHSYGPESPETGAIAQTVEAICETMFAAVQDRIDGDAALIMTADHGQIETPPEKALIVSAEDSISNILTTPPAGDARAAQLWLRDPHHMGKQLDTLAAMIDEHLKHTTGSSAPYTLTPTEEIIDAGLLGPVAVSDAVKRRWGHAVLIPTGHMAMEYSAPGSEPKRFKGNHSGLHPQEMRVPFTYIEAC